MPDLDEATSFYRDVLKGDVTGKEDLPEHGVTTVFVNLPNTKIELLYPYGEKSPIAGFLAKNKKGGIHHICIEVDNIREAMKDCEAKGIRLLNKGDYWLEKRFVNVFLEPKIGAHGKPVVFLHPADCNGVLTELEEAWEVHDSKKKLSKFNLIYC